MSARCFDTTARESQEAIGAPSCFFVSFVADFRRREFLIFASLRENRLSSSKATDGTVFPLKQPPARLFGCCSIGRNRPYLVVHPGEVAR